MHLPAALVILVVFCIFSALSRGNATEATETAYFSDEERAFTVDFKRRRTTHQQPAIAQTPRNASSFNINTIKRGRRELLGVNVDDMGEKCGRNPLHERIVDPAEYKYGCTDIHNMIRREHALLASGLVRDVYLVEYEGQPLVVKTLRNVDELRKQKLYLTMHKREVLTMDALKGHPNIVDMLGVCGTTVVTKFFKEDFKGSIRRRGAPMPIRQVVSLALGAAKGLQARHTPWATKQHALHEIVGGIHFDMKPQQLLIDDDGTAVVNDFNALKLMGRSPGPDEAFCAVHGGTPSQLITWRPPENYAGKPLTEKADIYSMGMIFYSLIAGRNPYDTPEALETAVSHGSKPDVDPSWHRGYMEVVEQMWLDDPERRPSARQVVVRLTAIQEEVGTFVKEAPVE
ncbi:unnamed protein product [Ectocarpus sp. 12 AP-2014]